ncbi:putative PPM-type phosphatase domain, AP-4 complex accessory subunit Tepsin [Helianthus annuus]|nr:putative PPM-type phosphatase domain, AP-4 complex accessory subunit Tepsin [Helianthus annuus]
MGKSGVEFRREMQRNSVAIRQPVHYKGQPDPLKDNSKPPQTEGLARRIEGFGNTNYNMPPSEDKKSFLSEVVGIGSTTIKLGLNSIAQAQTPKNDTGTYRSPNLRRSLTNETSYNDKNRLSTNSSGPWSQDKKISQTYINNGSASSSYSQEKSREKRLLETIVISGGVRLQPTRDAIQMFLSEATKLNALALSRALEVKLQSHMWQVPKEQWATQMDWYHKGRSLFSHLGLSQMCNMPTFLMVDCFLVFLDITETTKGKEIERTYTSGGSVCGSDDKPGVSRIRASIDETPEGPGLALSRAFGDFFVKDFGLISEPDVMQRTLTTRDRLVILATDRVWDEVSNEKAVEIVSSSVDERDESTKLLVEYAAAQ